MKIFLFAFSILVLFSCKTNYNLSEKRKLELNEKIDKMYDLDQKTRTHLFTIDSVYGLDKFSYMRNKESIKILLENRYNDYQRKIDSTWSVLKDIDTKHTKQIIDITKKYGFPNNVRLGVHKSKAYWLLVHAPDNFFIEINDLLEKEYKEKRIFECEMEYVFWHTKHQRKGMPPMCGMNKEAVWNK